MTHIVLAGGGTAGHIEPALNIAEELRAQRPDCGITLFGTERGLETTLVPKRGFQLVLIPAVPLPRRLNLDLMKIPMRLRKAVQASRAHLREVQADVVIGFGGYVALPAYLAARAEGIPLVVHEANARPGLANRIGARFAKLVIETVTGTLPNARNLGLPLRASIANFNREIARSAGLTKWSLRPERPTVLVFGGSQGARHLNEIVAAAAVELVQSGIQVLHAVGAKNLDQLNNTTPGYVTVPYIDNMDYAYGVADCAVTRAGAMTVAELTAVGLPALYVPLPIGNGEQRLNALPVVEAGGGVIIADAELQAADVVRVVRSWLPANFSTAAKAAAAYGRPTSSKDIVKEIWAVLDAKA